MAGDELFVPPEGNEPRPASPTVSTLPTLLYLPSVPTGYDMS